MTWEKFYKLLFINILLVFAIKLLAQSSNLTYPIVDTDQIKFYDNSGEISEPGKNNSFFGQDANYSGFLPSYTDNGDGTITDNVTGLMWQRDLFDSKYDFSEAFEIADSFALAGYNDWRVPTIKELYSLILFSGVTGMSSGEGIPYLDTDYFEFRSGDEYNSNSRYIDAQYVTSTAYVSTVFNVQPALFGVNFADGRIKGYPQTKEMEIKLVRGNTNYGENNFSDNNDETIRDNATGLMWDKTGSSEAMNWEESLEYIQELNSQNYLGYDDWRLPNAKELQSIIDYSRSPETSNSAAIDPIFEIPTIVDEGGSENYPFYWSSTTHLDGPPNQSAAVYLAFGEALGFMQGFGGYTLMDVHGAGAQRSDPKEGDPNYFPYGRGPQGDVVRIYNFVRVVRDVDLTTTDVEEIQGSIPSEFELEQNYPNPFNPSTKIRFSIPSVGDGFSTSSSNVVLKVYDILGNELTTLVNEQKPSGTYEVEFNAANYSSGLYLYQLTYENVVETKKMVLVK